MDSNFFNHKIEYSLLGLLVLENSLMTKAIGYLSADDFYSEKNKIIFKTMVDLHSENIEIDLPILISRVNEAKTNLFKGESLEDYFANLIKSAGVKSNLDSYIKIIVETAKKRSLKLKIKQLNSELETSGSDIDIIISDFQNALTEAKGVSSHDFKSSKEVLEEAIKEIQLKRSGKALSGISSNYRKLDKITTGFQRGDLIIIAARPSMGKTAFALNLGINISKNHNVAMFSLEMPSIQILNRVLSAESFVPGSKIRTASNLTNNDLQKIELKSEVIKKLKFFIDDTPGLRLSELVWKAKRLHKNIGLDIIIIDYLQLITMGNKHNGDNRQREVSIISSTLKKLARELEVPIIALSQLSRRVEQREDKKPLMSDIRESGAIEQDADLIMFLYRESYYNRPKDGGSSELDETIISIAKHRNGATGDVQLLFKPEISLFIEGRDE